MTYSYTTNFGSGTILAPCLQQLCYEISVHPRYKYVTNLGEIGDQSHQSEGYSSDHNPFIYHNGLHYVRAIDIGGAGALQQELYNFFNRKYGAKDPRCYYYGYAHKDNMITTWGGGGSDHYSAGDVGHLHISVTQANGNNPSPSGWVPALDSRAGWGLSAGAAPAPAPAKDWFDMATLAQLQAVTKAAVDERLRWWLPRHISTARSGKANAAFSVANSGAYVIDNKGIDGNVTTRALWVRKAVADDVNGHVFAYAGPRYVAFPDAPKNPGAIYAWSGTELLWLTLDDWQKIAAPHLAKLSAKGNVYKCPIAAGTPDPRI